MGKGLTLQADPALAFFLETAVEASTSVSPKRRQWEAWQLSQESLAARDNGHLAQEDSDEYRG